jgi:hypothetical protein
MDGKRRHLRVIETAQYDGIVPEAFASDLDVSIDCVGRPTLREGSKDGVEAEHELIVSVVDAIECQINVDLIAATESRWRSTLHGLVVDEVGGNVPHWCIILIEVVSVTLIAIAHYLRESAPHSLQAVGDVRELGALEPDFSSTFDASRPWLDVRNYGLLVVAESEASVHPILTVQRDREWLWRHGSLGRRREALDSRRLDELAFDDVVSDLAEWENTILRHLVEPSTGQVYDGASAGQATDWLNLLDEGLSVEVELIV